jgi:hypothetical protein
MSSIHVASLCWMRVEAREGPELAALSVVERVADEQLVLAVAVEVVLDRVMAGVDVLAGPLQVEVLVVDQKAV